MGIENVKWTDIPGGILSGGVQRWLIALGSDAGRVITRLNLDPEFATSAATLLVNLATTPRNTTAEMKKLLQPLFSLIVEAVDEFIAKEKFVKGETTNGVSIAWLGDNFKTNFLGKIEKNVEAAKLKINKLLEAVRDLPKEDEPGIIPELGGNHEIKLAHFFQLLARKQQAKDYTWIIAYVCDKNGVLWAVGADWDSGSDGWDVNASSVEYPGRWGAGDQVVSR